MGLREIFLGEKPHHLVHVPILPRAERRPMPGRNIPEVSKGMQGAVKRVVSEVVPPPEDLPKPKLLLDTEHGVQPISLKERNVIDMWRREWHGDPDPPKHRANIDK